MHITVTTLPGYTQAEKRQLAKKLKEEAASVGLFQDDYETKSAWKPFRLFPFVEHDRGHLVLSARLCVSS